MIFLDFEASGLLIPDSYPIEVGWAKIDKGRVAESDSILISRDRSWTHWDEESEKIHGLTREDLKAGKTPAEAAFLLNAAFGNATVLVDAFQWDWFWAERLYHAAKICPTWRVENMIPALYDLYEAKGKSFFRGTIMAALQEDRYHPHRAEADAKSLAEVVAIALARDGIEC